MSSQAVATSTRGGLPDQPRDPPDLHSFVTSVWPDHMKIDGQDSAPEHNQYEVRQSESPVAVAQSWNDINNEQRNQAVGNLLAALVPMTSGKRTNTFRVDAENLKAEGTTENKSEFISKEDKQTENIVNTNATDISDISDNQQLVSANNALAPSDFTLPPTNEDPNQKLKLTCMHSKVSTKEPVTTEPGDPSNQPVPDRREIEAFAKIEFEDGNYYITTYAVELGRDALAYKAALARAEEAKSSSQGRPQSSSGKVSRPSDRVRRPGDSQVQGSVVSEAGGFGGVDEDHPSNNGEHRGLEGEKSRSSQASAGSVVKPQEVLINPPSIPFDYHKNAERQAHLHPDNEKPAPVTADHLPKADTCPLIPIHATTNSAKSEVETHKGISRRHVKIEWDWDRECFKMTVLGRNGAFLNGKYVPKGVGKRLSHGSAIQISDVCMTFLLPNQRAEHTSDDSDRDDVDRSTTGRHSTSPTSNEIEGGRLLVNADGSNETFSKYGDGNAQSSDPLVGPDGLPLPPRKRGPGRPPKDGIMSTRERREREKAQKLADAKAANGGRTPPPILRGKFTKPLVREESLKIDPKPEKRKYKKRKRIGEDGDVLPSIEDGDLEVGSDNDKAPVKKPRASKSPSPGYPPVETLTEEQLARPSEPYARLIYDILVEIYPKALPLKQIYRALKMKFPFFVYRVDSEGWQSSVRHNLNQEWNKLFDKGEKEGKGFAWKAIPGALQPQAERKRAAQQAAAAKPKPATTPRNQPPSQVPQSPLNWQNSGMFSAPPNGIPPRGLPPFFPQGAHPPLPPQNGLQWPNSSSPAGTALQGSSGQQPTNATAPLGMLPRPASATAPSQTQSPRPQSSQTQPPSQASKAGASGGSAAKNMPCTVEGLLAIKRFESAMYDQVQSSSGNVEFWQGIFASAKSRILHGARESTMSGAETKEETTIMEHLRAFVEKFKNPNFIGHSALQQLQGQSPVASPVPSELRRGTESMPSNPPAESAKQDKDAPSADAEGSNEDEDEEDEEEEAE